MENSISLAMRLGASIVSGILLYTIPPNSNWQDDGVCMCCLVFVFYAISCIVSALSGSGSIKSDVYYISYIVIGIILSIATIVFGHLGCSAFIFLCCIISTIYEKVASESQ